MWWEESPNVGFRAKRKLIRSKEVVDRAQAQASEGNGKNYGVTHYAEPYLRSGTAWPTLADWQSEQSKNETVSDEDGEAKVAAQAVSAEAKAAAEVENDPELQAIIAKFTKKQ